MGAKFKRVYRVVIGKAGGQGLEIAPPLHCEFDFKKDASEDPNEHQVKLFNLNEATRKAISEPDQMILFYAGYAEDDGEILMASGAVADAQTHYDGGNVITEVVFADGMIEVRDTVISLGYASGVQAHDIIKGIAQKMGLHLMMAADLPNRVFAHGFSYYGAARTALHKVVQGSNLEWSVQNQTLQVIEKQGVTKRTALVIAPDTGMIGYPEATAEAARDKAKNKAQAGAKGSVEAIQARSGWRVTTLLTPQVNPGDRVKLESKMVDAFFRVASVRHSGGYEGGAWQTHLELLALKAPAK